MLYNDLYNPLKGRVHFTFLETQNGDASLSIKDLRLTDTGTYQCKVKRLPEIDIKYIFLTVMERPSKPVCYMEGEATAGKHVVLKCRSSQGTPPLNYRWSKTSGNQIVDTTFVDTIGGTLYLPDITEQDCGTYLCTVESLENKVIEEGDLESKCQKCINNLSECMSLFYDLDNVTTTQV
uniref:Coxsackievirus and adenovirus receptor n=1 Tax=Larimichthys crocea TaxID=215358 RepID=A0A0F8ASK5_LARCR